MTLSIFIALMLYLLPIMNFILIEEDDEENETIYWAEVLFWPILMTMEIVVSMISALYDLFHR